MAPVPSDMDVEVTALLASTRQLVGQAHRLSKSINATVEELAEFAADIAAGRAAEYHDRRISNQPHEGEDRRA